MDINLTASRTFDVSIAYEIVNHPSIVEAAFEDGQPSITPDVVADCWILMQTESGLIAGVYNLAKIRQRAFEVHAYMLPEFRESYSKLSGYRFLEWCVNNVEFDKINTMIPKTAKHVWHFTKKFGFKDEGFDRKSFLKDGKLVGQYIIGITKEEVLESLGAANE